MLSDLIHSVGAFSRGLIRPTHLERGRFKLGVALGGGFARGIAHIGALKVLDEEKIPIDLVAGASVGAIIGACYCSGMTLAELADLAGTLRLTDFARLAPSRYGLYNNDRMEQLFARVLKPHTFEDLRIPLAITATELRTGRAVVFTKGELVAPIRASCAFPGMFLPVEFKGSFYVDGMLAYGVPATPLRQLGADCVVGIYLTAHWGNERLPRHALEVVEQCFFIAETRLAEFWRKDADLVIEPDVIRFAHDCFEHTPDLIAAGESAMRAALPTLRAMMNNSQRSTTQKVGGRSIAATIAPA